MQILDRTLIERKLARLSAEILEVHAEHARVFLVGVNNNGYATAQYLAELMQRDVATFQLATEIVLRRVKINPAAPLAPEPVYEGDVAELAGAHVIIVDDVANTGRTAHYASKPILDVVPASLEIAVLVDRLHKQWPVSSDYVGLTLSTSLQDDIRVHYEGEWRAEIF